MPVRSCPNCGFVIANPSQPCPSCGAAPPTQSSPFADGPNETSAPKTTDQPLRKNAARGAHNRAVVILTFLLFVSVGGLFFYGRFGGFARVHLAARYVEETDGYSICPPQGWNVMDIPALKFRVIAMAGENDANPISNVTPNATPNFTPNINLRLDTQNGQQATLTDYRKNAVLHLKQTIKDLEIVAQDTLRTESGIDGQRVVVLNPMEGGLLRQTAYVFMKEKGVFLVITCTVLAEGGEAFDDIFEASVKTLEWTK
ncbi:MAG: hypothetical protein LBR61_13805 [Synergistaceae bacterium]|jgi:rubredoxin|nr:hypothetical protein [Synergistaceae bacterium]